MLQLCVMGDTWKGLRGSGGGCSPPRRHIRPGQKFWYKLVHHGQEGKVAAVSCQWRRGLINSCAGREVAASPSLEIFKTRLDKALTSRVNFELSPGQSRSLD